MFIRKLSLCTATLAAAWGDEHDAFKKLAETVGEAETPLIVAGVPISNSDTHPVNPKLAVSRAAAATKLATCS